MSLPELPFITRNDNSLIIHVYIQPRAAKNQICGMFGNELKISLTSPPVDGAANKLCREFIAGMFNVAKSSVTIIAGDTSRHKRLHISGQQPGQFTAQLLSLAQKLL